MADKKISALSSASTPLSGTEVLPIVQSSVTVKVPVNDLTVKNIRSNSTTGVLQIVGPSESSTRIATIPDANFTVARTDAAQSFTGLQTFGDGLSASHPSTFAFSYGDFKNANLVLSSALGTGNGYIINLSGQTEINFGSTYQYAGQYATDTGVTASAAVVVDSQVSIYANLGLTPGNLYSRTRRANVDGSGNMTLDTGNLILATSGKGVTLKSPNGLITKTLSIDNSGLITLT